jgi:hypothetical protein
MQTNLFTNTLNLEDLLTLNEPDDSKSCGAEHEHYTCTRVADHDDIHIAIAALPRVVAPNGTIAVDFLFVTAMWEQ